MDRTAVIAVGGNSLILDNRHPEVERQWEAVRETCEHIAEMVEAGWKVIVTHGNGPQVGFILRRNELAAPEVHETPFDLIVADTQGSIGYMLQQTLNNTLRVRGINRSVVTVITQVVVDRDDPAFTAPSKPIGKFMSEEETGKFKLAGWNLVEDSGRGWRRVVASPQPREIVEQGAIRSMIKSGYIVVACGGGGVPVIRNAEGSLEGVAAVIDKDLASSLLAQSLRADLFIISTGVERVAINFNTPDQRDLPQMTLAQAHQYLEEGHFAKGSMRPKVEAVVDFIEKGGPRALITNPSSLGAALRGETGTWITPN